MFTKNQDKFYTSWINNLTKSTNLAPNSIFFAKSRRRIIFIKPNMEETNKNQGNKRGIIILLLLLLLTSAGINYYLYNRVRIIEVEVSKSDSRLVSTDNLKKELQQELEKVRAELEVYRQKSGKYDEEITAKENLLIEKAHQIEKLFKDNKINYRKFLAAKDGL
ncbi:MAG: hypothetical protein NTX03_01610, partial [Bacteroidetes bacterium]|nr:hypothetical protein [Bacteroidota bacterium]